MEPRQGPKRTLALDQGGPAGAGRRASDLRQLPQPGRRHEMVFLDGDGREVRRCDWPYENPPGVADLDGDGRDELIFWLDGRLRAWDTDLRDLWSRPGDLGFVESIIRPTKDRPARLLLYSGAFLDGKTGRPAWLTVREPEPDGRGAPGTILDPGDAARPPLLIAQQAGTTIARTATPATPAGRPGPARPGRRRPSLDPPAPLDPPDRLHHRGEGVSRHRGPGPRQRGPAAGDPPAGRPPPPLDHPAADGSADRRRRPADGLSGLRAPGPGQIGATPASPRLVFSLLTLAGVPIVALVAKAGRDLIRHRWKAIARLAALTVAASVLVAVAWLVFDSNHRPSYDRYEGSSWYLAGIPGGVCRRRADGRRLAAPRRRTGS